MVTKPTVLLCFGVFLIFKIHWRVQAQVSCNTTGRFPLRNDATCKNYTLCMFSANNNSLVSYNHVCPSTSLFNPNLQQCSTNYTCGANTASGLCTIAGRFPTANDNSCRSYVLCVLAANGTFSAYNYTCPTPSLFSPVLRRCTANYTCPASR